MEDSPKPPRCREERYAEIVRTLCGIVTELLDSAPNDELCQNCPLVPLAPNVDAKEKSRVPEEELPLTRLFEEFNLTQHQVLMLRRFADFPQPLRRRNRHFFRREEVEAWIASQPNPDSPADALRRPRRKSLRVGSRECDRVLQLVSGSTRS
jgi:hypothetical protein